MALIITTTNMEDKTQAFLDDYKALIDKYKMDFVAFPAFVPDKDGGFRIIVQTAPVDTSKQSVKSNFITDDKQN